MPLYHSTIVGNYHTTTVLWYDIDTLAQYYSMYFTQCKRTVVGYCQSTTVL